MRDIQIPPYGSTYDMSPLLIFGMPKKIPIFIKKREKMAKIWAIEAKKTGFVTLWQILQ